MRSPFIAFALTAAIITHVGGLSTTAVAGQAWPQRTVRIITPFPAGTGGDVSARMFADRLAQRWGKPVIIENRPGAQGVVALGAFVNGRDDHTLLYTNGGPLTVSPLTQEKLFYDPRDIVPITLATNAFVVLTVPTSLKIGSLEEFLAFARSHPGVLNWGATPGALEFIVPSFLKGAGIEMVHVPYRELAPAMNDLTEGRLQAYFSALASVQPQIQAGKLKALVVTSRERAPSAPDVPAVVETAHSELLFDAFLGFFGLRDMPTELREHLAREITIVGADPLLRERMASLGQAVHTSSPSELASRVEEERAKVAAIVQTLGTNPAR